MFLGAEPLRPKLVLTCIDLLEIIITLVRDINRAQSDVKVQLVIKLPGEWKPEASAKLDWSLLFPLVLCSIRENTCVKYARFKLD